MTFLPNDDWALKASEYNLRRDWRVAVTNEYQRGSSGQLNIRRSERINRFSDHKVEENYRYTFDEIANEVAPAAVFTLTTFGLPEPGEAASANYESKAHYWFIGGAVALFVVAIGLRWASRR
jgi:hypothetical protein